MVMHVSKKHIYTTVGICLLVMVAVLYYWDERRATGQPILEAEANLSATDAKKVGSSILSKDTTFRKQSPGNKNNTDQFSEEVDEWLAEISQRDDLIRPEAAKEAFTKLGDEYDTIETMQGRVVLQIDNDSPIFDGQYYVRLEEIEPENPKSAPWRYMIRLRDPKTGWNVLTHTKLKGSEKVPSWREGQGKVDDESLPPILEQLPFMPVSPISLMRIPRKDRYGFFRGIITDIHRTQPEEEDGLEGGPFWIFDRTNTQYWLSKDGELRRVRSFRRSPRGNDIIEIDKTFEKYQTTADVRYPTVITTRLTARGPAALSYVKKCIGKEKTNVEIKVSLSDMQINTQIPETWFQSPSE